MWIEQILERGFFPDMLIRWGIRRLLTQTRRGLQKRYSDNLDVKRREFTEMLSKNPIAVNTLDANEQHYEVPAKFFQYVMGRHMKYSSGYWPNDKMTLDESEEAMLALSAERAQIGDGQSILELGCGWGSFTLYIAAKYPRCQVTGVSNSASQKKHIDSEAQKRGLANVSIVTADMNTFQIDQSFDRVVSIEMFEHMRNYQHLFERISSWMKPDGLLFVHIFCHRIYPYLFEDGNGNDSWITRNFFSGGTMPSADLFSFFDRDLRIIEQWPVNGRHYQRTLEAWLRKMDQNKKAIFPILRDVYGPAEVTKRWVYWRVFMMACSEMMGYNNGTEWFVQHYLFKRARPALSIP